jgi:TolB-like protein
MNRLVLLALVAAFSLPMLAAAEAAPPTVAVLYFDYDGQDAELVTLRKGLAQMLVTDLDASIKVVERQRLQQVLDELKLAGSRSIDRTTAARVGKLLGARYLVMGGYFVVGGMFRVDARVVEVETGRVIKSIGATSKPDEFMTAHATLVEGLNSTLSALPATKRRKARKRPKRPKKLTVTVASRYGKALDAMDKKDVETAKTEIKAVVAAQPDFSLASSDLDQLMAR